MSLYKRSKAKSSTPVEPNSSCKRQRQEDHAEIPSSSSSSILSYFPTTGKTNTQKSAPPKGAPHPVKKVSPPPATIVTPSTPVSMSSTGAFTLSFGAPAAPKPHDTRHKEIPSKHTPTPSKPSTRPIRHPSKLKYDNPYTKPQTSPRETEVRVHGNTRVHVFGDSSSAPLATETVAASHLSQSQLQSTSSSASTSHATKETTVTSVPAPHQRTQILPVPAHKASVSTAPGAPLTTSTTSINMTTTAITPVASTKAAVTAAVATSAPAAVAKRQKTLASAQSIAFLSPRLLQRLSVAATAYAPLPPSTTTTTSTLPTTTAASGMRVATSTGGRITGVSTASKIPSQGSLPEAMSMSKPMLHARRVVLPVDVTSHPLLRTMAATFQLFAPVNTLNTVAREALVPSEAKPPQSLLMPRQYSTEPVRKSASADFSACAMNDEGNHQWPTVDAPQTTGDGDKQSDSNGENGDAAVVLMQIYAELAANMPVADMILYTHTQATHTTGTARATNTTTITPAVAASTAATPLPAGQSPREVASASAAMSSLGILVENEDTLTVGPELVAVKLVDDGTIAEMGGGSCTAAGMSTCPGYGYGYGRGHGYGSGTDVSEDVLDDTGHGENNKGNTTSRALSKDTFGLRGGSGGKTREFRGHFPDMCHSYPLHSRSEIIEFCRRHRSGALLAFLLPSPTALSLQHLATHSCGIPANQVVFAARLEQLPSVLMGIGARARGIGFGHARDLTLTHDIVQYIDEEVAEAFSSLALAPSCLPRPWELSAISHAHPPQPPLVRGGVRGRAHGSMGGYVTGLSDEYATSSGNGAGGDKGVSLSDLATMDIEQILQSTSLNKEDATLLRGWIRGEVADSEWVGVVEP